MHFAFQSEGKNPDGDFGEDEVFAIISSNEFKTSPVDQKEEQRLNKNENFDSLKSYQRLQPKFCCAQWCISRRCLDCAWISQRGGRPTHPVPPFYSWDNSSPLVTLKSLGKRDDSGYEPSPISLSSFSFPSDDDEDANTEVFNDKHLEMPTNVNNRKFIPDAKEWEANKNTEMDEIDGSPQLKRSKSLPELWSSEKVLPRTPIMIRNDFLKTPLRTPVHGRNSSLPATTADGKPLFVTPSTNQSQEGLIDLTKYKGKSTGYNRRVLVLALPDILVDLNGSVLSTSKIPSGYRSTKISESLKKRPELSCISSSPSSCSSELYDYDSISPRPTWRRPRALSCDVTLEVEFGQELRKIADDFSKKNLSREGSVWGALKRGLERRFSLGDNNRIEILEEDGVSHSLPSTLNL